MLWHAKESATVLNCILCYTHICLLRKCPAPLFAPTQCIVCFT